MFFFLFANCLEEFFELVRLVQWWSTLAVEVEEEALHDGVSSLVEETEE